MINLIQAEGRKLTTVRSWWALAAAVVIYPLLMLVALTSDPSGEPVEFGTDTIFMLIRGGADVAMVAALLLGILAVSGEYRHGTVVSSLLAEPRRGPFIGAKLITQSMAGAALAIAAAIVSVVAGGIYVSSTGVDIFTQSNSDMAITAAGVVGVGAVFGAIGAGLGAVIRNQTAAVTGALVWLLAVENALPLVLRQPGLRDWTLSGAAGRLFHVADPVAGTPSAWSAAVLLTVVAVSLGLIALAVTVRADVE